MVIKCSSECIVDSCSSSSTEKELCAPRISLSEGLVFMESDSVLHAAAEACESMYSFDFEFLMSLVAASEVGCSHRQSMCFADKLFSNGQILPLDQVEVSQPASYEEGKAKQFTITEYLRLEMNPAAISTRCWRDMFKLKGPTHKNSVAAAPGVASSEDKQVFGARSMWSLRRSRTKSTQENKSPDPRMPNVDPWRRRSASDSRINPCLPSSAGTLSRQVSSKPKSKASAEKHYDAFKFESDQILSQNSCCSNAKTNFISMPDIAAVPKCKAKGIRMSTPGRTCVEKRRTSISPQRRARDALEGRVAAKTLDNGMTGKLAHTIKTSKRLNADRGIDISQRQREAARSGSNKQQFRRKPSRGGSYQAAPVLQMQVCMDRSFIAPKLSKSRLVDLCKSFLKKDRLPKQNEGATIWNLSHRRDR